MSSGYDEFVARVEQNTLHETIYTDSEGRTIVVIDMEDLFSYFELKKQWGWEMKAEEILAKAAGHLADRAKTYDKPEGERSMRKTVDMFNVLTGGELTEEEGWMFMVLLKMVRSQQGEHKDDNYEDGAAYFALAGESTY
jgi:hypothetical protein